jgi:CheY-like chemotaxis protein
MQRIARTVLIVTDDVAHRSRLARRLHELGCDVITADNGALGVLAAHEERPALIVAESRMPIMNGYHMVEALRSEPATSAIPVILLEAAVDDAVIARCWSHGADFCLPKGSGWGDLLLAIDRTIGGIGAAEYPTRQSYAA